MLISMNHKEIAAAALPARSAAAVARPAAAQQGSSDISNLIYLVYVFQFQWIKY